jgi:hypothetical protein
MDATLRTNIIATVTQEYKEIFSLTDSQCVQVEKELGELSDEALLTEWKHIQEYYGEITQALNMMKVNMIQTEEKLENMNTAPDLSLSLL